GVFSLNNVTIQQTHSGGQNCAEFQNGVIVFMTNVTFGACNAVVINLGAIVSIAATGVTWSGNIADALVIDDATFNTNGFPVTISSSPTMTTFLVCTGHAHVTFQSSTITGSPSAGTQKFIINGGCNVTSGNGSTSYFPGTVSGTQLSPATYDGVLAV